MASSYASSFMSSPPSEDYETKGSGFLVASGFASQPDSSESPMTDTDASGDSAGGRAVLFGSPLSQAQADNGHGNAAHVTSNRRPTNRHKHSRSRDDTDDPFSPSSSAYSAVPSSAKRARFRESDTPMSEKPPAAAVPATPPPPPPPPSSARLGFGNQPLLGLPVSNKRKRKMSFELLGFPKPSAPDGTGVDLVPRRDSEPAALAFQSAPAPYDITGRASPAKKAKLPERENPESKVAADKRSGSVPFSSGFLGPFAPASAVVAVGAGDPTCWTEERVSQWIVESLPKVYHRYVEILRQNGVDGELLFQLEDTDLATFIELPLHRKKLLVEVSRLRKRHNIPTPSHAQSVEPADEEATESDMEDDNPVADTDSSPAADTQTTTPVKKVVLGGPSFGRDRRRSKRSSRKYESPTTNADNARELRADARHDSDPTFRDFTDGNDTRENTGSRSHLRSKSDTTSSTSRAMTGVPLRSCREANPSALSGRASTGSDPGYTYFGELAEDAADGRDGRFDDAPTWNVISCPQGHPKDQMVACFIDNSTLALEASSLAAEMRGMCDDPADSSSSSTGLRLDFGALLGSICDQQGVSPCCLAVYIYGITPPQRDSVWRRTATHVREVDNEGDRSLSFLDCLDEPFRLTREQFTSHNGCAHVEKMMRNDLKYAPYHGYRRFVVVNSDSCDFSFAMSKVLSVVSANVSLWCWDHTLRESEKLTQLTEVEFPLKASVVSLNERLNDLISTDGGSGGGDFTSGYRSMSPPLSANSHCSCFGPRRTHPSANRSFVLRSGEYTRSALMRWLREEVCLPNERFRFQEDGACLVVFDVRLSADEIGDIYSSCAEHVGRATSWSSYYHSLGCPNLTELHPQTLFDPLEEPLVLRKCLQSDQSQDRRRDDFHSEMSPRDAKSGPLQLSVVEFDDALVNPESISPTTNSSRGGTMTLSRVRSVSPVSLSASRSAAAATQKPKSHSLTPPKYLTTAPGVSLREDDTPSMRDESPFGLPTRGRSRTRSRMQAAEKYPEEMKEDDNIRRGQIGGVGRSIGGGVSRSEQVRDRTQKPFKHRTQNQRQRKKRNCIYGKFCRDMHRCTFGLHSASDRALWQASGRPKLPKKTNDCANGPQCAHFVSAAGECSFRHDGEQYFCCLCEARANHHSKHCDKRFASRK